MKLSEELAWRGFVAETTIKNPAELDNRENKQFYWGADPSADSLTIGNLAALMMCACFVRHGYKPYLLVGGATGQIGDPKDTAERELKPLAEVEHNKACIKAQIERVIGDATMVDNLDWFKNIGYLDFLRTVGKALSMTQLLDRKFIQSRIGEGGSGISYAEFSYALIQGYDFLHLYRTYGVDLQLCGADQYGNASTGISLIRKFEDKKADVWSTPLVIDPVTGRKFGKSEGNAIWLASSDNGSGNFTSVFDFYQFWLNQPDASVEYLMKIYTLYDREEVEEILKIHAEHPERREAQKALALGATSVVHGEAAARAVESLTARIFDRQITPEDLETASKNFPTVALKSGQIAKNNAAAKNENEPENESRTKSEPLPLLDILVATGLAASKNEAKTLLKSGAISVNFEKITDPAVILTEPALLKRGKNKFAVVR